MADAAGHDPDAATAEEDRLAEDAAGRADWRLWGTYLPERQWGTVREDYSADGDAWGAVSYDMSRRRAYRWGEDGLLGWTDREGLLCFSLACWNGRDTHLKEKLFGLSNRQGNHGEDVRELYYYLDATPSGAYAKAFYKYPQCAFPYAALIEENARRGYDAPEYELLDTGAFADDRYFDITVEYAKLAPADTLIRLTVTNNGPQAADITVLPTLVFRNLWSWDEVPDERPTMQTVDHAGSQAILARHPGLGDYRLTLLEDAAPLLFTDNDSNADALGGRGARLQQGRVPPQCGGGRG